MSKFSAMLRPRLGRCEAVIVSVRSTHIRPRTPNRWVGDRPNGFRAEIRRTRTHSPASRRPRSHRDCDMDLDDLPIGRVLTRREAIALLGASGALLLLGCSSDSSATTDPGETSSCVVRPELTEDPITWTKSSTGRTSGPTLGWDREGRRAPGPELQRITCVVECLPSHWRGRSSMCGIVTLSGCTPTCPTRPSEIRSGRSSCGAIS